VGWIIIVPRQNGGTEENVTAVCRTIKERRGHAFMNADPSQPVGGGMATAAGGDGGQQATGLPEDGGPRPTLPPIPLFRSTMGTQR
jgi:hypothetical protein